MQKSSTEPVWAVQSMDCDVLVAGGGLSGVCCALSAARSGVKVVLCQDRPVLGGNASSEIRMHVISSNWNRPQLPLELEVRESGIIEEIRLENAYRNPQRSPSMFDLILYEKCLAEPNLTLLLNTRVTEASVEGNRITMAKAMRHSTEDEFRIRASIYVDCTGDGGLGYAAGAEYVQGREGQEVYGETAAPEQSDRKSLGSSLLLMGRKHDQPMPFIAPAWARKFTAEDFKGREDIFTTYNNGCWDYGYWWLTWGGHLNTLKDNEVIRHELLRIVMGIWDFIKNGGDHGADHWALEWFGMVPGKRESRRFIGQHVLTEHDLLKSKKFEDAIAYGGWSMELQPPEGMDSKGSGPVHHHEMQYLYDIPLRSCISRNISNLMFAGRNLSASHVAFSSTRIMSTCSIVGEGVGMAAAVSVQSGVIPQELCQHPELIREIRQRLLKQDAFLIGERDGGTGNLLNEAQVSASSEQPDGKAPLVLSGQNRCVAHTRGVSPDRAIKGTHRWMSDPSQGLPAWLEFRWPEEREVHRLQFVFDSGLHRKLTLTMSSQIASKMIWGTGQPELVKAFCVEYLGKGGQWQTLAAVPLNWQRRWVYVLPKPVRTRAIRIQVTETWGLDHARIISAWAE
jgi:hypothetical protein